MLLFNRKTTTTLSAVEKNTMPKANALKNLKFSKFFNCSQKTTKYVVTSVLKN